MTEPGVQPSDNLNQAARGEVRVKALADPGNVQLGSGWNFRLHFIYMPVFTLVSFGFLYAGLSSFFHIWFPLAQDNFLWSGGLFTIGGFWFFVLALLPLAALSSRFIVWFLLEAQAGDPNFRSTESYARQQGVKDAIAATKLTQVNPRTMLICVLWVLGGMPAMYGFGSDYFSLGPSEAIVGPGDFHSPHHHPWADLRDIKASCKPAPDGKGHAVSYVLSFDGGDTVAVPLSDPDEIEDFLASSRKLGPVLKNQPFTFSYDGDPGCPSRWLPAFSRKPGGG